MAGARTVNVEITAGMSKYLRDMDQAKAKIRDLGTGQRSTMIEATASIRTMEGDWGRNIRAVERFASVTLGLGPIFKAVFPVVGAIAFVDILGQGAAKIYEIFEKLKEGPEKAVGAFRELGNSLSSSNDELQVSNDRLQIEIDKLSGNSPNRLKLALDEAEVSADKLAEALDRDMASINKVLKDKDNGPSWFSLMLGTQGTQDIAKWFGGFTGKGGFTAQIAKITDDGKAALKGLTDAGKIKAAQDETSAKLTKAYADGLAYLNVQLGITKLNQQASTGGFADYQFRIEAVTSLVRDLSEVQRSVGEHGAQRGKEALKDQAEDAKDAADNLKKLREEAERWSLVQEHIGAEGIRLMDESMAASAKAGLKWFDEAQAREDREAKGNETLARLEDEYNTNRQDSYLKSLDVIMSAENKRFDEQHASRLADEMTAKEFNDAIALDAQIANDQIVALDLKREQERSDLLFKEEQKREEMEKAAERQREQLIDKEATKMQEFFDRNILHAKSVSQAFKNIAMDIGKSFESVAFKKLAQAIGPLADTSSPGGATKAKPAGIAGMLMQSLAGLFKGVGGSGAMNSAASTMPSWAAGPSADFMFPGLAGGGAIYGPSIVGEKGPELFVPHSAGTIIPNGRGVGGSTVINVDARGADAAVEHRVMAGVAAAHSSAVQTALLAQQEMQLRTPSH